MLIPKRACYSVLVTGAYQWLQPQAGGVAYGLRQRSSARCALLMPNQVTPFLLKNGP